ncbi:MAG: hypothetical protein R2771_14560 [Saprospiraceae bacterium]
MKKLLISISLLISLNSFSQISPNEKVDSFQYEQSFIIYLDSVVVSAVNQGFVIEDFIELIQNDETFYRAFKNLRYSDYDFSNDITFFTKKNKTSGKLQSVNHQYFNDNCRWMDVSSTSENYGIYDKKGNSEYFTMDMYEKQFFTEGLICDIDTAVDINFKSTGGSKIENYSTELKKLIFSPGSDIDIPLIGNKMEIFSPEMQKYYDYSFYHSYYNGEIPSYVFSVNLKKSLKQSQQNKTVIKYLNTYFQSDNLQVLAREYHLKYKFPGMDFDVVINIKLDKKNNIYYPTTIYYSGNWNVLFKKREISTFKTNIYNFKYKL